MAKQFQSGILSFGVVASAVFAAVLAAPTASAAPPDSPEKLRAVAQEQEIESQIKRVQSQVTMIQNELEEQVLAAESQLARDLGRGYLNIYSQWNGKQMQLDALLKVKMEIAQNIAGLMVDLKELDRLRKEGEKTPEFEREIRTDPRCLGLRQRLDTLDINLELAERAGTPDKAGLSQLRQERDAVRRKLDSATDELRTALLESAYRKASNQRAAMQANALVVNETVTALATEIGKMNELTADYARLQQREQTLRDRIKRLEEERYRLLDHLDDVRRSVPPGAPKS